MARKKLDTATEFVVCTACGAAGVPYRFDHGLQHKIVSRHLAPCGAICVAGALFERPWPAEDELHRCERCPYCGTKNGRASARQRRLRQAHA
jgi:ssDNA-binding Zn-finger/Zn-ribbon topoisomerase 1